MVKSQTSIDQRFINHNVSGPIKLMHMSDLTRSLFGKVEITMITNAGMQKAIPLIDIEVDFNLKSFIINEYPAQGIRTYKSYK